jgi:hypothetical protein
MDNLIIAIKVLTGSNTEQHKKAEEYIYSLQTNSSKKIHFN